MRKGELKKQEFLRAAEIRFCRDGYEKTGVQDILDDLHTSKGSFYHHFECATYMYKTRCISEIESDFQDTLLKCRAVTPETIKHEKLFYKLAGELLKLVAPLF